MTASPRERVFVVGAGASVDAGLPLQDSLLREVFASPPPIGPHVARGTFEEQRELLRAYLERVFGADATERLSAIPLEDVFTSLDKACLRRDSLHGFRYEELDDTRRALVFCLAVLLDAKQVAADKDRTIRRFAETVAAENAAGTRRNTILSLNWDTTLDRAVPDPAGDWQVDYGAMTYPFVDEDLERVADPPHLYKTAMGRPSVGFVKIHGSLNWLACATCERLLIHPLRNIAQFGAHPPHDARRRACPFCGDGASRLEPVVVMPSMLKDISNVHLRMMWHNAHLALSRADEVVFIGYSLPLADYEFKYLLAKALGSGPKTYPRIRVVSRRRPDAGEPDGTQRRYRGFFGKRLRDEDYLECGFEGYVTDAFGDAS